MRKTAIFEDVVSIMTQDSATKKDIAGADPTGFRECISDDMSEKDFLYQVQTYLASFGVIGHVAFRERNMLNQKVLFYVQQSKDFMLSRLMQIRICRRAIKL